MEAVKANAAARAAALLEAKVVKLLELLKGAVRDTVDRTEKKLVQTWEELQADMEEVWMTDWHIETAVIGHYPGQSDNTPVFDVWGSQWLVNVWHTRHQPRLKWRRWWWTAIPRRKYTIHWTFLWAGMASPFPIGCTSSMASTRSGLGCFLCKGMFWGFCVRS